MDLYRNLWLKFSCQVQINFLKKVQKYFIVGIYIAYVFIVYRRRFRTRSKSRLKPVAVVTWSKVRRSQSFSNECQLLCIYIYM